MSRAREAPRALISRVVLDALIRNKLMITPGCEGVEALPVVHDAARSEGANWKVPGWLGEPRRIESCRDQLEGYVRFLASQFEAYL